MQHRLQERAKDVNELLEQKAYLYVCGDAANMAREVNSVLAQIIAEQRGIPEDKGEEIVKNMRASNPYQVRHPRHYSSCSFTMNGHTPTPLNQARSLTYLQEDVWS